MSHFPPDAESKNNTVLLIGVTGGTGGNVVKGFREQGITNLRVITRKIDFTRPSLSKLNDAGVELVPADLDGQPPTTNRSTDIVGVSWEV